MKDEVYTNKNLWKAQYNWKIFLNICRNSKVVKDNIELELSVLAESVLKIQQVFPEEYRKEFKIDIKFQEILKKFIQYLQAGIVNKVRIYYRKIFDSFRTLLIYFEINSRIQITWYSCLTC